MKVQVLAFLAIALTASSSFAQNTSTAQLPEAEKAMSSQGFRVGFVAPFLTISSKFSALGMSITSSDAADSAMGASVGYAHLPVQAIGFTTNLAYIGVKNNGISAGLTRLDGNIAYAASEFINIKGGLNVSKFVSTELKKLDAGIGFQGGIGIQLTKNFGIDIGYMQMNQSKNIDDVNLEVREAGFEIGLNATF